MYFVKSNLPNDVHFDNIVQSRHTSAASHRGGKFLSALIGEVTILLGVARYVHIPSAPYLCDINWSQPHLLRSFVQTRPYLLSSEYDPRHVALNS
ncbi:MAG: hypothetical protein OXF06_05285 [Bacteroidetes bacterium]|nr:hypothetical protein [Bacteroidota bacterium]